MGHGSVGFLDVFAVKNVFLFSNNYVAFPCDWPKAVFSHPTHQPKLARAWDIDVVELSGTTTTKKGVGDDSCW